MNTNIWGDFQICISVPLKEIMAINIAYKDSTDTIIAYEIYSLQ